MLNVDPAVHSSKCDNFVLNTIEFFFPNDISHVIRFLRRDADDDKSIDEYDYDYLVIDHSYSASKRNYLPYADVGVLTQNKVSTLKNAYTKRLKVLRDIEEEKRESISALILYPRFWQSDDRLDPAMSWIWYLKEWSMYTNNTGRDFVNFEVLTIENEMAANDVRSNEGYSKQRNVFVHSHDEWLDNVGTDVFVDALSISDIHQMERLLPVLCKHLSKYDVIIYQDSMFLFNDLRKFHIFELILHITWVRKTPAIRIFDDSMFADKDINSNRLYATGFLLVSTSLLTSVSISLEICDGGDMVNTLPPLLPTSVLPQPRSFEHKYEKERKEDEERTVTILYAGGMVPSGCPGGFVRIAASLVSMQKREKYLTQELQKVFKFIVLDYGNIGDPIKLLIEAHEELSGHVIYYSMKDRFTPDALKEFSRLLGEEVDIIVDPCPTGSRNIVVYPLASYFGIHIVQYNSSSSKEWLVENQEVTFVSPSTVEKMAETLLSLTTESPTQCVDKERRDDIRSLAIDAFDGNLSILTVHDMIARVLEAKKAQGDDFATLRMPINVNITNKQHTMHTSMETEDDSDGHYKQPDDNYDAANLKVDFRHDDIGECNFDVDEDSRVNLMIIRALKKQLLVRNTNMNNFKSKHRLLCSIFTHEKRHYNVRMQKQTFGRKCDGFIAFSDVNDSTINAV